MSTQVQYVSEAYIPAQPLHAFQPYEMYAPSAPMPSGPHVEYQPQPAYSQQPQPAYSQHPQPAYTQVLSHLHHHRAPSVCVLVCCFVGVLLLSIMHLGASTSSGHHMWLKMKTHVDWCNRNRRSLRKYEKFKISRSPCVRGCSIAELLVKQLKGLVGGCRWRRKCKSKGRVSIE